MTDTSIRPARLRPRPALTLLLAGLTALSIWPAWAQPLGDDLDHAAVLRSLDAATEARGKNLYEGYCAACHGVDGEAMLPTARSFNRDSLKYGADPYSMWKTVSEGRGMMVAQTWIAPVDRYYVIQYIRERLIKPDNPGQYFEITDAYLDDLPGPEDGAPAGNDDQR